MRSQNREFILWDIVCVWKRPIRKPHWPFWRLSPSPVPLAWEKVADRPDEGPLPDKIQTPAIGAKSPHPPCRAPSPILLRYRYASRERAIISKSFADVT